MNARAGSWRAICPRPCRVGRAAPNFQFHPTVNPQPRIVTITLNPAIDETVLLARFEPGTVNRATDLHRQAGGKGVNVSAMLGRYGIPSIATGFLGEDNPQLFTELFTRHRITDAFVRIPGETRCGIKLIDLASQETTDINFRGLSPSPADLGRLLEGLETLVQPGGWVVVAGSLPEGFGLDAFAQMLARIRAGGAKLAVDTSGAALMTAIRAGVDLIKPNHHELAECLGRGLPDFASRVEAARALQRDAVPQVIVSMGAEGALFLGPESALLASAPPVKVLSTVGAGDSLLAGYLAGLSSGADPAHCAKLATVFAGCALEDLQRRLPSPADLQERLSRIRVEPL